MIDWRTSLQARPVDASEKVEERLFRSRSETARLLRVVRSFLAGQVGAPPELLSALNGANGSSGEPPRQTRDGQVAEALPREVEQLEIASQLSDVRASRTAPSKEGNAPVREPAP
jgi:hypothetical protein